MSFSMLLVTDNFVDNFLQDQVKPSGNRGEDFGWEQKCYLRVSIDRAHELWVDQLPIGKQAAAPGVSTFRKWLPFWVRLRDERHAISCVCVHHHTHEMLEAAIRRLRVNLHRSKRVRNDTLTCRFGTRCDCACAACIVDEPLLSAAVCPTQYGQLSVLSCILQQCDECGLQKVLRCPRKENNATETSGTVRLMRCVKCSIPGHKDKDLWKPVSERQSLDGLFTEMSEKFGFMLMHDYLARRLASRFRKDIDDLRLDEEVSVKSKSPML